jgi:hypothetical protein
MICIVRYVFREVGEEEEEVIPRAAVFRQQGVLLLRREVLLPAAAALQRRAHPRTTPTPRPRRVPPRRLGSTHTGVLHRDLREDPFHLKDCTTDPIPHILITTHPTTDHHRLGREINPFHHILTKVLFRPVDLTIPISVRRHSPLIFLNRFLQVRR